MQTRSIHVSTLCVPCENRCRYCLLSWDGKLLGADYDRCQRYAEGFYLWLKENRPEISFQFYYGYAMEHPRIGDAIDFARKIGSAGGEFLQLDGLKFRPAPDLEAWLRNIQNHGIRAINLTFYGTRAYHDRFAAREGDFDHMLVILSQANSLGLETDVGIPITAENAQQMEALLDILESYRIQSIRIFIPHREGRGASLEKIRLTGKQLEQLSPRVLGHINMARFRTEGKWVREGRFTEPQNRMLGISLTPDNMKMFENMSYSDAIAWVEALDEAYYAAIPSLASLAEQYGDPNGDQLFDQRDLYLYYQHKYICEHHLKLYNIHDERHCFSRRY